MDLAELDAETRRGTPPVPADTTQHPRSGWLKREWSAFFKVLLYPWALVCLLVTIAFGYVLTRQTDQRLITLLTVLVGVLASLWGGLAGNRLMEITGEKALVARGKTAVRSLRTLWLNILALERRVQTYIDCHANGQITPELARTYLDETLERCAGLERETLASIDNWTEIVPDAAAVASYLARLADLQSQKATQTDALADLRQSLAEVVGKSAAQEEELRRQIQEHERALTKIKKELAQQAAKVQFPAGSLGDLATTISVPHHGNAFPFLATGIPYLAAGESSNVINVSGERTCAKCGRRYVPAPTPNGLMSIRIGPDLCPDCAAK